MLTVLDAKVIAGKELVDRFGLDFVRDNIGRKLFTGVVDREDSYQVDFEMFKDDVFGKEISFDESIVNNESVFPDIVLSVLINKQSGRPTISEQ